MHKNSNSTNLTIILFRDHLTFSDHVHDLFSVHEANFDQVSFHSYEGHFSCLIFFIKMIEDRNENEIVFSE